VSHYHGHEKLQEWELSQEHSKEKNHKKYKRVSNQRLKTQSYKIRTWYMLKDDSNGTLF
jgi:hypothetical protein